MALHYFYSTSIITHRVNPYLPLRPKVDHAFDATVVSGRSDRLAMRLILIKGPPPLSLALVYSKYSKDETISTLEELVCQIRDGSDSAIADLYHQLRPGMKIFLKRRIGIDYEDALQDSFLALLAGIQSGSLQHPSALRSYLCTIMIRECRNAYHNPRQVELDVTSEQFGCSGAVNAMHLSFERDSKRRFVTDALDRLPIRMRMVIEMCFLEEKPNEVVKKELFLSETQFRLLKSRAKFRLVEEVRRIQSIQSLKKSVSSERTAHAADMVVAG